MIKIKFYIAILIAVGLLAGQAVFADFEPQDWRYVKAISLPEMQDSSYVKTKLDHETLAHSSGLADLRIVSGGLEVGYQLVAEDETVRNAAYASQVLDLSSQNGNTSFIIDLGRDGNIHSRITILSSSVNYKRQVSVYASDSRLSLNDANWRLLTNRGYIYNFNDLQAGFNAGSGEVAYPKSTSRYLKVVVHNGEGNNLAVSGAEVYRYEIQDAEEDTLSVQAVIKENPVHNKSTELTFDIGVPGIPTHSITLSSNDTNFSRRVVIEASTDGTNWSAISQGSVFNISTNLFLGKNLTLEYPEQRAQYIRIVVLNEDNQPVHFGQSASIKSTARYIIFNATPGYEYQLAYGNPFARTPHYDISRFFEYIETRSLPTATLAAEHLNTAYEVPLPPPLPFTERYPYLLNVVLVLLAVIVAAFITLYLMKLKKISGKNNL